MRRSRNRAPSMRDVLDRSRFESQSSRANEIPFCQTIRTLAMGGHFELV
jgi:hypothetical protein